jgi:rubredoxin
MNGDVVIDGFARLSDDSKLECRICWYVYDPGEGDAQTQVPPGTPFRELPGYWRCPQCDSGPEVFIPLEG